MPHKHILDKRQPNPLDLLKQEIFETTSICLIISSLPTTENECRFGRCRIHEFNPWRCRAAVNAKRHDFMKPFQPPIISLVSGDLQTNNIPIMMLWNMYFRLHFHGYWMDINSSNFTGVPLKETPLRRAALFSIQGSNRTTHTQIANCLCKFVRIPMFFW